MAATKQLQRPLAAVGGETESIETVVIGAGQAGLAVGYYLAKTGRPFVILDANERVGDSWRQRWDSLLLFTPARFDGLPGLRFPASGGKFIPKDAMADYVENYAKTFRLPVRNNSRVDRLARRGEGYVVSTNGREIVADNVVVAMSNAQVPSVPAYARDLDPGIVQLHSKEYRNLGQLQEGPVLIVGAGNSGADIAMEAVQEHETWMAGKESGHIPFRIEPFMARNFLMRIVRFAGHRVLTIRTPVGKKLRPKLLTMAAPLVRVKPKDLVAAGVERVPRVVGVVDGKPLLEDGRTVDVANVIWCSGFRPGFSWIDLPILGDRQEPAHVAGIVPGYDGLYFVGLHFLYSMTSETISGVGRDARRIVKHLARRSAKKKAGVKLAAATTP